MRKTTGFGTVDTLDSSIPVITMAADAPDPQEVTEFKFRELRQIPVFSEENWFPSNSINLVASSSRFGLVFAGHKNGFKVFAIDSILDLDEQKISVNEIDDHLCVKVPLQSEPSCLSLSCDEMTLGVCITKSGCPHLEMYDIRAFVGKPCEPAPFTTVQLSSVPETHLVDFAWNPSIPGVFASCISDGSISVFEQTESSLKIIGTLPKIGATCICWSPKGKQLVAGKKDGSMAQYKPNLQEAKQIPPPSIFENPVSVLNILWLQTTVFAVVYVPGGNNSEKIPYFVLVSLPKGSPPVHINYNDVCLGAGDQMSPRYMMLQIAEWSVIICASKNSVETAVLGCSDEKSHWIQWLLEGTGRADLPIIRDQETYPLGMSLLMSAQRTIVISESESYPPMPVMFLLSSAGILCPFHVINSRPNAPSLVQQLEILQKNGERKPRSLPAGLTTLQPQLTSTPLSAKTTGPSAVPARSNLFNQVIAGDKTFHAIPVQSISSGQPSIIAGTPKATIASTSQGTSIGSMPSFLSSAKAPSMSSSLAVSEPVASPPKTSLSSSVAVGMNSPLSRQTVSSASHSDPSAQAEQTLARMARKGSMSGDASVRPHKAFSDSKSLKSEEGEESLSKGTLDDACISEALNEMKAFEEELHEMKHQLLSLNTEVGTREEMKVLREQTQHMSAFYEELKKAMTSINSDVHNLKNYNLESFAMLEEARSRYERNKDPWYVGLLRGRALDPITARSLQEMRKLEQYLDIQVTEINRKLDQDWQDLSEMKKNQDKRRSYLPSAEMIYRTLLNNNKLIFSLAEQLDRLSSELKEVKSEVKWHSLQLSSVMETSVTEDELSALADTLLEAKIGTPPKKKVHDKRPKSLSSGKQGILREALLQRPIRSVRAPMTTTLKSYVPALESLKERAKDRAKLKEKVDTLFKESDNSSLQPEPQKTTVPVSQLNGFSADVRQQKTLETSVGPSEAVTLKLPSTVQNVSVIVIKSETDRNDQNVGHTNMTVPLKQPVQAMIGMPPYLQSVDTRKVFQPSPVASVASQVPFSSAISVAQARSPFSTSFGNNSQALPLQKFSFVPEAGSSSVVSSSSLGRPSGSSLVASGMYENITPPPTPQPVVGDTSLEECKTEEPQEEQVEETVEETQQMPNQQGLTGTPFTNKQQSADTAVTQVSSAKSTNEEPKPTPESLKINSSISSGSVNLNVSQSVAPTFETPVFQMKPPVFVNKEAAKDGKTVTSQIAFASPASASNDAENISPIPSSVPSAGTLKESMMANENVMSSAAPISIFGNKSNVQQPALSSEAPVTTATLILSIPSPVFNVQTTDFSKDVAPSGFTTSLPPPSALSAQPKSEVGTSPTSVETETAPDNSKKEKLLAEGDKVDIAKSAAAFSFTSLSSSMGSFLGGKGLEQSQKAAGSPAFDTSQTSSSSGTVTSQQTASVFGRKFSFSGTPAGESTTKSVFGFAPPKTSAVSPFGQSTASTALSSPSIFGKTTEFSFSQQTQSSPSFGQPEVSKSVPFGQSSSPTSTFGASPATSAPGTSLFGHISQTGSLFGGSTATSTPSMFAQGNVSPIGQGTSAFGQVSKPTFGQSGSSIFGQSPVTTSSSPFSQPTSSASATLPFGQSGGGGFFSGLGGQPNPENANKNVFGSTANSFRQQSTLGSSGFGSPPSFGGGSGGGGSSLFGGSPKFGSSPMFGSGAAFSNPLGSVFGSPSQSSGFGCQTQAPTFGALAQQNQGPTFGALAQQPNQSTGFGSPSFGSSPTFGNQQQQGFGSPRPGGSAFTQWRN